MKFTEIRVLCFSALFCGVCRGVEKTRVLEKFIDKNYPPTITVQKLVCGDADGELSTPEYQKNFDISDSYGVEGFPTFIFEGKRADGSGFEIARADAESVSAFTLKELQRVFDAGVAEAEELSDGVLSQDEASKQIPW